MHHAGGMVLGIIYNNRYTVGSRHTDAYVCQVGHQGIDAFQGCLPGIFRQEEEGAAYLCDASTMHLMRHHQTVVADAERLGEQGSVSGDSLGTVAAIAVDVKVAIVACTETTVTGGAEGRRAFTYYII